MGARAIAPSSLLLLLAGVTVAVCVTAVASIPIVPGIPAVAGILLVPALCF